MSLTERLFGRAHRALASVRTGRGGGTDERAATLAALAPRLRLLACALAEREVELAPASDGGGVSGHRLLVPPAITTAPSAELNERLFLLRVAYAAASLRSGLVLPATVAPADGACWTLLAVPATLALCRRELPAIWRLYAALAPYVLAARPDVRKLAPADAALEALARLHLGETPAALATCVGPDVLSWARAAAAEHPATPAELAAAHRRVAGTFGRGRLVPVVVFGALLQRPHDPTPFTVIGGTETPSATGSERRHERPPDALRRIDLATEALEENPALHAFEKVRTAEEYRGGKRRVDGDDELVEHADALDELDLREVVRGGAPARSIYRADLALEGGSGDLDGELPAVDAVPYDEWDERCRQYRPAWCHVRAGRLAERRAPGEVERWRRGAEVAHATQIRALRLAFARVQQGRAWQGRQPDGPDIDLDAVVQRHAALRSGHLPPERLYASRRRHAHDLATLILLDASLSTDAWIAGRRVLDVARDAVFVLGEALASTSISVGIAAFASHTRHDCRFLSIKDFDEPWTGAIGRLASVEPGGYTRIGPALRHGTEVLARTGARRRLLLLVSDGKPTDYDRYEGRYGVADVRQAVREGERRAVRHFALAIEAKGRAYLPQMFGAGNHAILPRSNALAGALAHVVADLAR